MPLMIPQNQPFQQIQIVPGQIQVTVSFGIRRAAALALLLASLWLLLYLVNSYIMLSCTIQS